MIYRGLRGFRGTRKSGRFLRGEGEGNGNIGIRGAARGEIRRMRVLRGETRGIQRV